MHLLAAMTRCKFSLYHFQSIIYVFKYNIQFRESLHLDHGKYFPICGFLPLSCLTHDILALSPWEAKWKVSLAGAGWDEQQAGTFWGPEEDERLRTTGPKGNRRLDSRCPIVARSPVVARTDRRFWLGRRSWARDAMSAKGLLCTGGTETFI